MPENPKSPEHQAVVEEIRRLQKEFEAGRLTGFVAVLVMADGTRQEFIVGTMADEPPAVIESIREVLSELADGETPGAGLSKH